MAAASVVDLKELGIDVEPTWWESLLKVGMIFAATFQALCIGFAIFGPDKEGIMIEDATQLTGRAQRKASGSPTENGSRKKSKQDKKKR